MKSRIKIPISEIDPRQALNELKIYQEELESQNRELQEIKRQNELLIKKYSTLYNQSPSGYLTLDREARIQELNFVALSFLGLDRSKLLSMDFREFISSDTREVFDKFFVQIFTGAHKISCEAILNLNENKPVYVHFDGISTNDGQNCLITIVDITQLKETEEALKLSRSQFQNYFENGSVGMTVSSPGKGWLELNQKFCGMLGYTKEELIGMDWMDISHPGDLANNLPHYVQLLDGKIGRVQMDKRLIRKDGKILYVTLSVTSQHNPDGTILLLSSYLDVTDVKLAEIALRKSEESYRNLLEFAPDAFFQGDSEGNLIKVNDKALEFTGYSRQELLGINMADLFPKEILQEKPLRYDLLKTYSSITNERDVRRKDGTIIHIEMNSKIMPDGTYQCLMKDITARKRAEQALMESEERFRSIFEDSPDAIILADLKSGIIIDANHAAEKLLAKNISEIIGIHHSMIHPLRDEEVTKIAIEEWAKKSKIRENKLIERIVLRSDGKEIPVEILSKVISLKGKPVIHATFRNIARRKKAEKELRESEKLYRLITENSGDVIWKLDVETLKFTYVSPSVYKLRGFTVEEVMQQDVKAALTVESQIMLKNILLERLKNYNCEKNEIHIYEISQPCKDGKIVRTEISTRFIRNETNNRLEILGVSRNITERKLAKDALEFS